MALEGHVDFYGYNADVEGWLFSGWSSTWPDEGEQRRVTGHFEEGDVHGEHLVTFFHRQDVGDRGLGFILFIKAARSDLNQFISIEVASGDTVGQLVPMPRPPRLAPLDLIAALAPTLDGRARDGAGGALRELVWQKVPVALLGEAPSAVAYETGRPAKRSAVQSGKQRKGEAEPAGRGGAARIPAARHDQIDPKSLPSGFFNPDFYLAEYADVRTDREYGSAPFSHFIQNGLREGRQGSYAYDIHAMRAVLEKRTRASLNGEQTARMFLSLPAKEKFVPNNWFNGVLFRKRYHNQIEDPESSDYELFILYLAEAGRSAWSPNGLFDEAAYQANHPDIRSAIRRGQISSGYEHFVTVGWAEGRAVAPMLVEDSAGSWPRSVRDFLISPRTREVDFLPWFADRFYRSIHADVHAAVRSGEFENGLEHFLVAGFAEGRIPHPGLVHLARIGRFPADLAVLTGRPGPSAQTVDLGDGAWLYQHILRRGWHREPTRLNNLIWGMVTPPKISGVFDATAYLSCNPDLELPESDPDEVRRHWERHGLDEGRIAPFSNVFAARTVDPEMIFALPQGINYIGPLSLETGMGYAARGYIDALRAGGVPVAEFDVSGIIHDGRPIDLFSPDSLPYAHNLIHLNPDQVPHFIAKFGTDIMNERMNIGFWAWELGAPRPEWRGILSGFDLILVPSQYARAAIAAFTNTPVLAVPHVVERNRLLAAARKAETNAALDAVEAERNAGRKLILAVVDSSSYARRKGVDVFIRIAHELGRREPGRYLFCLKTHSRDRSSPAPSGDMPGLMVIDGLWGWSELCKLRSLADLYVSPHRSEGFGLNVFESIVMGVPTLASRSGGVTDILGDDYPLYIEGKAVQVGRDLGPYRKNALWFEPDIDKAIDAIRAAVSPDFPRAEYERLTVRRIVRDLSVKAVGRQLKDTLRAHCGLGLDLTAFAKTLLASRKQCFRIPELGDNGPQSSGAERDRALAAINPFFSIITPTFNTKPEWLRELYQDLLAQECPAWEWCIYDDGSTAPDTRAALRELKEADARVLVTFGATNAGIVTATNNAVALSSGVFVAFVDHDDRVAPELLSSYRREIDRDPTIDVLYCDEDKLLPDGSYGDHYYKPDWSPEHLTSTMYVLHCLCARKQLFLKLGGYRPETSGAQDHDFSLRAAVANARFHHVDQVLYHWRVVEGSAAAAPDAKPYTNEAGLRAVRNYLAQIGLGGTVEPGLLHGTYRIRPAITDPKVTLNILTTPGYGMIDGRRELYVDHFVASILKFDPGLDIVIRVIVNEGNEQLVRHMKKWDRRIKIESCPSSQQAFNFAKKANWAVRSSPTERVVLLNDDMEAIDDGWLPALIEMLEVPGVAVAGARLLYDDDSIQHAGIALGVNGASTHLFAGAPSDYIGYNAFTHVIRNYSAVTGACMAFTRSTFARLGGLDESFPVDFNDTDFCLKVIAAGLRVVYTPFAILRHFESSSLTRTAADPIDTDAFCRRWGQYIDHDPHYNSNLTRSSVFCEAAR